MSTYNIAGPRPYSLNDVVLALEEQTQTRLIRAAVPLPTGMAHTTHADLHAAAADLGYQPQVHLDQGLAAQLAAWRSARSSASPSDAVLTSRHRCA
jgi:UDP-glucuronate 4-epimerase